jgi:serine/threonine protein kinase
VARALAHAHGATWANGEPGGIVHRDVSPSNVMLLRAGGIKILDFGIAKAAALARPVDEGSGKHPKLQGHLGYLSPEQIRGTEVDRRSDLFSLGVVLWEMLTGQHLFAGKDEFETMRNVLLRPVPAPSRRRLRVPAALEEIVARALDRDPQSRYQSAGEMAEDLDLFLADAPCPDDAVSALLDRLFGSDGRVAPDPTADAGGDVGVDVDFGIEVAAPRASVPARLLAAFVAGAALLALGAFWMARGGCFGWSRDGDQSSSARSVSTSR